MTVLLTVTTAFSGTNSGIVDESGSAIKGAYILIHDGSAPNPSQISSNWETQTTSDGRFNVKMESGCYDVFVSATFFSPFASRVCVTDNNHAIFKAKMKADRHAMVLRID
jgi:hypothetical protein